MRLLALLLVLCVFTLFPTQAQDYEQELEDIIHLKSGKILHGQITPEENKEYVILEMVGGTVLKVYFVDIDKIEYGDSRFINTREKYNFNPKLPTVKRRGLVSRVGLTIGEQPLNQIIPGNFFNVSNVHSSLTYSLQYRIRRRVDVGLGTGYQTSTFGVHFPLLAVVDADLLRSPISPTFSVKAGVLAPLGRRWQVESLNTGALVKTTMGLRIRTYNGNDIRLLMGAQWTSFGGSVWVWDATFTDRRIENFDFSTIGFLTEIAVSL